MPSSPQTLSPPATASQKDLASGLVRGGRHGASRSSGALSKVAWEAQGDLGRAEWLATGRRLGTIGRCSQWWIGDWIRYGNAKWGEKYAEAARVTGYDAASLRNMAWVASRFDVSLRSDKLSWSHHVLLAPLEPDERRAWLERASRERFSVNDLRQALRGLREGGSESPAEEAGGAAADRRDPGICPQCGHRLDPPAEQ